MIVFNDTDRVIVYFPETNQADYIRAEQGTIIVDNSLLNEKQEHRYRFTLGHECGHWIFHRAYFGYAPNQLSLFNSDIPFLQCREINGNYLCDATDAWDEARWMEWHADKFSAGILMPETAAHLLMKKNGFGNRVSGESAYRAVCLIAATFNVSEQAAYFRLCDLGYIQKARAETTGRQLSFL